LATYDVSVYLDPAQVNATALDALVLTLSSAGLAPTTATSDPVSELASIPGIDSGLLATFKNETAVAVAAEAAAVEAEASAEAAEQSLSDAVRADGSGDAASESGLNATAGAVPPPPTAGAVAPASAESAPASAKTLGRRLRELGAENRLRGPRGSRGVRMRRRVSKRFGRRDARFLDYVCIATL
jgi:hypothetical protein